MKRGFEVSAETMRLPSLPATSLSGGNCSLRLTIADCEPAVERPSSHSLASMMRRKSATSSLLRTFSTHVSMKLAVAPSVARREDHIGGPARCFQHERRSALVQRVVVALVEDVVHEQLDLPVLVDLGLREHVETPIARKRRALVGREQGAAVDLRTV